MHLLLNTSSLRVSAFVSPEQASNRKYIFAQRQRHLIVGQSRVIKGVLFAAVVLGNRRTLSPAQLGRTPGETQQQAAVVFRRQNSDPYIKTGISHDSMRLLAERGFR